MLRLRRIHRPDLAPTPIAAEAREAVLSVGTRMRAACVRAVLAAVPGPLEQLAAELFAALAGPFGLAENELFLFFNVCHFREFQRVLGVVYGIPAIRFVCWLQ